MKTTLEIDDALYREAKAVAVARLKECFTFADKVMEKAPRHITGRDILAQDRNRHLSE